MSSRSVPHEAPTQKAAATRGFVPDPGVDSASDNMFSPKLSPCGVYSKDIEIGLEIRRVRARLSRALSVVGRIAVPGYSLRSVGRAVCLAALGVKPGRRGGLPGRTGSVCRTQVLSPN